MRYQALPAPAIRKKEIPALDGGLAAGGAVAPEENRLGECVNFWWKDGAMRNRPGLSVKAETVRQITAPARYQVIGGTNEAAGPTRKFVVLSWSEAAPSTVTAELVSLSAEGAQTVSTVRQYTEDTLAFAFFSENGAAGGEGVRTDGALLYFHKKADGTLLILAEPADPEEEWIDLSEQVHVPLLLTGGTGSETQGGGTGGFAMEEENLLTPWFRAQYTAGRYPYYRLPKSGLDDTAVTVTLLTGEGGTLTFTVAAGTALSPAAGDYRVHLDRTTGVFYFCAASGSSDTPVILGDSDQANNIEVTASKDNSQEREPLLGMTACIWFGGWQGLYSGNQLFVSGNPAYPERMYWSGVENPLYFPRSNYRGVGNAPYPVTAFACLKDKLLLFKEREVYSAEKATVESPVDGSVSEVYTLSLLSPSIGCDCPRTIRLCSDRLLWADSRGEVYGLKEADEYSNASVMRLTQNIASRLAAHAGEELRGAFAVDYAGHYVLVAGRRAYCLRYTDSEFRRLFSSGDPSGEGLCWYSWDFGEGRQTDAGVSSGARASFLCRENPAGGAGTAFCYAAALDGDTDGTAQSGAETPVPCLIESVPLTLEPKERRKNLRRLFLWMENTREAGVVYRTDREDFRDPQQLPASGAKGGRIHRLSPSLTRVESLRLRLECRGETAVGGMVIQYTAGRGAG